MRKIFFLSLFVVALFSTQNNITDLHFIVPGGKGGGWDSTARTVGGVLLDAGIIQNITYENISGNGGAHAIHSFLFESREQPNILLVNSTPIVIRSLQGFYTTSYKDLTPIASVIVDYGVLVVRKDEFSNWQELLFFAKNNHSALKLGGGSIHGGMDHLVVSKIFRLGGVNPKTLEYKAFDAGGVAMEELVKGEVDVLSTGFGEAIQAHLRGEIKIIGVTSKKSIQNIPSFRSLGIDLFFANWRGFFANANLKQKKASQLAKLLAQIYKTPSWKKVSQENGWSDFYLAPDAFKDFLFEQENEIKNLMKEMG